MWHEKKQSGEGWIRGAMTGKRKAQKGFESEWLGSESKQT